jgi:OPA family glycerol-3-phosphate transporter-like MFS transporter
MGQLIAHGLSWRAVFYFAAAVAGIALLTNALLLRESRTAAGFSEPQVNPLNLYGEDAGDRFSVRALLGPLARSRAFQLVCLLSFGCTVVRGTFDNWTPEYLRDYLGESASRAATLSALFPAVGAVSVLACGILSDRLGPGGRPQLLFAGLIATALALLLMMAVPRGLHGSWLPLVPIGLVALCLLGPYSFLGGAFALDFGGKRAAAAASGIIDGIGYLGGALAGDTVARISVNFGWRSVFLLLAGCCALSAAAAGYLHALSAAPRLAQRTAS